MYNRDMNSGYSGFSMSRRAVEAYDNGEMPISKWTKKAIFESIDDCYEESELPFSLDVLKKAPLELLKDMVLHHSSWHHTSQYANATHFYSIDNEKISSLTNEVILDRINNFKKPSSSLQKKENNILYVKVRYGEWEGSRKHPKLVWYDDIGTISNNVFNSGKDKYAKSKRTTGKHFAVIEELSYEEYKKLIPENN